MLDQPRGQALLLLGSQQGEPPDLVHVRGHRVAPRQGPATGGRDLRDRWVLEVIDVLGLGDLRSRLDQVWIDLGVLVLGVGLGVLVDAFLGLGIFLGRLLADVDHLLRPLLARGRLGDAVCHRVVETVLHATTRGISGCPSRRS